MSKNKVDEINAMASDMSEELIAIKVKSDQLILPEEAHSFPKDMIKEGHEWLTKIYQNQFAAVRTVRNLLTKDQWNRYTLWGSFSETQEMKLLKEKQIPFRKVVISRERPQIFKKGVQSEQIKSINSKKGN